MCNQITITCVIIIVEFELLYYYNFYKKKAEFYV